VPCQISAFSHMLFPYCKAIGEIYRRTYGNARGGACVDRCGEATGRRSNSDDPKLNAGELKVCHLDRRAVSGSGLRARLSAVPSEAVS
jgi:hypothetical protein